MVAAGDQPGEAQRHPRWAALNGDDPESVRRSLSESFRGSEQEVVVTGLVGDEVSLVVAAPSTGVVPERRPTTTAAGNVSLERLTRTEVAELYRQAVNGHVLAAARRVFAVAPAVSGVRILVVRAGRRTVSGKRKTEALTAVCFDRRVLNGVQWATSDATAIVEEIGDSLIFRLKGKARELQPLDLEEHPLYRSMLADANLVTSMRPR